MSGVVKFALTIIISASIAGGGVYYWQSEMAKSEHEVLRGENDSLRLQVDQLEEAIAQKSPEPEPAPEPAPPAPAEPAPAPDSDKVVTIVKQDCTARKLDITKGTFTLVKIDTTFAKVDFNCTGAPVTNRGILKKTGETWALIYKASPPPSRTIINRYAIPPDFQ